MCDATEHLAASLSQFWWETRPMGRLLRTSLDTAAPCQWNDWNDRNVHNQEVVMRPDYTHKQVCSIYTLLQYGAGG